MERLYAGIIIRVSFTAKRMNNIIEYFRKEAVKCEIDINFRKEKTKDMKIEDVFMRSDGNFSHVIEDLDMDDFI